jgi:hypothetical protein
LGATLTACIVMQFCGSSESFWLICVVRSWSLRQHSATTVAVWLPAFMYFTSFWMCQYSLGRSDCLVLRSFQRSSSSDDSASSVESDESLFVPLRPRIEEAQLLRRSELTELCRPSDTDGGFSVSLLDGDFGFSLASFASLTSFSFFLPFGAVVAGLKPAWPKEISIYLCALWKQTKVESVKQR